MNNTRSTVSKHAKGFTLVELTLATAIFVFFLMLSIAGLLNAVQIFQKTSAVAANTQAARLVIEEIRREAQFASSTRIVDYPTLSGPSKALCVERAQFGDVVFFVDRVDPADFDDDIDYTTHHIYKRDGCGTPSGVENTTRAQVGGNSGAIDNSNVAGSTTNPKSNNHGFFLFPVKSDNGLNVSSVVVQLRIQQIGPGASELSGIAINRSFDDSIALSTVLTSLGSILNE